jgi:tRNA(fMet)-specific endonuclease VapC
LSMRLRYLLDTNILSHLIRHPGGRAADRIAFVGEAAICTSIVVAAEFRFGAARSESKELKNAVELILSAIEILPLEEPVDREYAKLRHHLALRGTPIGPNDLLIAAHALSEGLVVVTANTREFSRVPLLQVEDWLAEEAAP